MNTSLGKYQRCAVGPTGSSPCQRNECTLVRSKIKLQTDVGIEFRIGFLREIQRKEPVEMLLEHAGFVNSIISYIGVADTA